MATVLRYDAGTLQAPRRTATGGWRVDGHASNTGILTYRNPDGSTRRELRLPDDVFHQDSLSGFEGAPITEDHPPQMVDLATLPHVRKGTVLSARKDGDHVAVSFTVEDPELIKKMQAGLKRQLSVGYNVDLDPTPGEHPKYGRYDAIQRKIAVNHLAVLSAGRAGPTACVRMDSAYQCDDAADGDTIDPDLHHPQLGSAGEHPNTNAAQDAVRAEADRFGQVVYADAGAKKAAYDDLVKRMADLGVDPIDFIKKWYGRYDQYGSPAPDMHPEAQACRDDMDQFGEQSYPDPGAKRVAYDALMTRSKAAGVNTDAFEKKWADRLDAEDFFAWCRYDDTLTAEDRDKLKSKSFAAPDGGLPVEDEAHTRAAMSRFGQEKFPDAASKKTAYDKIVARAKHFGIDSSGFEARWKDRLDDLRVDEEERGSDGKWTSGGGNAQADAHAAGAKDAAHEASTVAGREGATQRQKDAAVTARLHAANAVAAAKNGDAAGAFESANKAHEATADAKRRYEPGAKDSDKPGAKEANAASRTAKAASDKAYKSGSATDHMAAARAHDEAAKLHDKAVGAIAGGQPAVNHHEKMAESHDNIAAIKQKAAAAEGRPTSTNMLTGEVTQHETTAEVLAGTSRAGNAKDVSAPGAKAEQAGQSNYAEPTSHVAHAAMAAESSRKAEEARANGDIKGANQHTRDAVEHYKAASAAAKAELNDHKANGGKRASSGTKTFVQAKAAHLAELSKRGWGVKPDLKVPHATSPDGKTRLWFKSQAVHVTKIKDKPTENERSSPWGGHDGAAPTRHEFGNARTLGVDTRTASTGDIINHASSRADGQPLASTLPARCDCCDDPDCKNHASCLAASGMPKYGERDDQLEPEPQVNLEQALAALAATNEKLGAAHQRADAADKALADAQAEIDKSKARKTERNDALAKLATAEAAIAAEKARADIAETAIAAAEKARTDAAGEFVKQVAERVKLETVANAILGSSDKDGKAIDRTALSNRDIKCAVVKHVDAVDIAADQHEAYVTARFDSAVERNGKALTSVAAARTTIETGRKDGAADQTKSGHAAEAKATAAMRDEMTSAWTITKKGQ